MVLSNNGGKLQMEINWEELGDSLVEKLKKDPEFTKFCEDQAAAYDESILELLEAKFVRPLVEKNFKFNDEDEDDHYEFTLNMTHGLADAFNKYFVTQYLGRKW